MSGSESALDGASNSDGSAAVVDSFQSAFSQAATSGSRPPLPVPPGVSSYSTKVPAIKSASSEASTISGVGEKGSKSANPVNAGLSSDPSKTPAAGAPQRSTKRETSIQSAQILKNQTNRMTVVEMSPNMPATDSSLAAPGVAPPPTTQKKVSSGGVTSENGLPIVATNALGGLKSLCASAFAMHITVPGNQVSAGQGNPNQSNPNPGNPNQGNANARDDSPNALAPVRSAATQPDGGASAASATPIHSLPENATGVPSPVFALPLNAAASAAPAAPQTGSPESVATVVTASEIGPDELAGAPQTVRTVQMQLGGEGQSRVEVRLVEHGGGLSVSVRASDSALTKGLQENLPDLSARLAEEKYQIHTFLPSVTEASNGGSSSSSSDQSSGQSHEQGARETLWQQGDGSGRRQNGQPGGRQHKDQESAGWRQLAALGKLSSSLSNSTSGSPGPTPAESAFNK